MGGIRFPEPSPPSPAAYHPIESGRPTLTISAPWDVIASTVVEALADCIAALLAGMSARAGDGATCKRLDAMLISSSP